MFNILYIILLAVTIVFSGCGREKIDADTVTVWHWMSDREEAFQELSNRYQESTGIRVKFDLYAPSESYSQKVKAAAQTNTLPDIFGILGESRDLASFIKSGYVAELSVLIDEVDGGLLRDTLFEKAIAVNQFLEGNTFGVQPGIYGVPLDVTTIQLVYNKKLFRKAGLDPDIPPRTWNEFTMVTAPFTIISSSAICLNNERTCTQSGSV